MFLYEFTEGIARKRDTRRRFQVAWLKSVDRGGGCERESTRIRSSSCRTCMFRFATFPPILYPSETSRMPKAAREEVMSDKADI